VRSLLIADGAPWPALGGNLIRLAQVVGAVSAASDLDLFVLHNAGRPEPDVPPAVHVRRSGGAPFPRMSGSLPWRLAWTVRRGLPLEVAMAEADRGPAVALREWARPPYDVVWFSTARSYQWTGRADLGPTVVDLDNLEDVKARLRTKLLSEQLRSARGASAVRVRLAQTQSTLNARAWHRFQESVAAQVQQVVIASDVDAARSGLSNISVIPNTYPRPARPSGNPAVSGAPIVLFQGHLGYPPNIDAAEWLATSILPMIRSSVPTTEVRLVGLPGANVQNLHRAGTVTVVGQVPSMTEELGRATVVAVPIRYGSGTRVKILESFAHRVPVVSTTLGAEGLDVEDGVHLLMADEPEAFAASVVRLLGDPELRVSLADAAEARYLERYDGREADERVRRLVEDVARSSTRT
jgi:Glycosyl transferases group 1